jgi:protein O-mannosyl-transferase
MPLARFCRSLPDELTRVPPPLSQRDRLLPWILLPGLCAIAFWPALGGGFVWDDHLLIGNNAAWRSARGLWHALGADFWSTSLEVGSQPRYYRPLVSLAYYGEFQLFGLQPRGYHLVNVALHVACVLLAFVWLRGRLARAGLAHGELGALVGAALFALHPSRTEAVSWISGCTDLWMTAFALGALLCVRSPRAGVRLGLAPLLAAAALLSKEAAVVLPVLLALDAWLLAAPQTRRSELQAAGAVAGGLVAALLLRSAFVSLPATSLAAALQQPLPRVLSSFGHYLDAVLAPLTPTVLRGKVAMNAQGELVYEPLSVLLGAFGFALCALLCALAPRRRALWPWLADAAWFVVALLPVLNLLPLELKALVADRYLYLPLLGLSALLARATAVLWAEARTAVRALAGGAALVAALAFLIAIWVQTQAFASDEALWQRELDLDPERAYVLEASATMSMNAGDFARAQTLASAGLLLAKQTGQSGPELRFTLLAANAAARASRDCDQPRLLALRAFYDRLAHGGTAELALPPLQAEGRVLAPALTLAARWSPRQRKLLAGELVDFHLARAELHVRTFDLAGARAVLERERRSAPRAPELLARLAVLDALEHRFDAAGSAATAAVQLAPASRSALAAARAVAMAARVASVEPGDARGRVLRDAQIELLLGAYGQARARLAGALGAAPDDLELIALAARTDALDRRSDLARARIEQAQRAHPEAADQWSALLAELR